MIIYSCPDCDGDLEDEGLTLWCPGCQASVPAAALAPGEDDDLDGRRR